MTNQQTNKLTVSARGDYEIVSERIFDAPRERVIGDGRTEVTAGSRFDMIEDRDGMLSSGMEIGLGQSYEQLDELLASS